MQPNENTEEVQLSQQQIIELAEEVSRIYGMDVEVIKRNIQTVFERFNSAS